MKKKPMFTMKQSEWDALSPKSRKAMATMLKAVHKMVEKGKPIQ